MKSGMKLLWLVSVVLLTVGCAPASRPAASAEAVAALCPGASGSPLPSGAVTSVTPLRSQHVVGKFAYERLGGASVRLRADGVTRADLQRALDCHLARRDAGMLDASARPDDALAPPSGRATAVVKNDAAGYVVEIAGDTRAAAAEIYERASRLAPAATN